MNKEISMEILDKQIFDMNTMMSNILNKLNQEEIWKTGFIATINVLIDLKVEKILLERSMDVR